MQLPYIDDRRMVLYGKVTALFKFGKSILYGSHQSYHMLCLFVFLALFCFSLQAFGGYLTLKMLATTDKLFRCTATVAPITDFRLYSELGSCH